MRPSALSSLPGLQHWQDAAKWLLWGCALGLAPVWISSIIFVILGQGADTPSLLDKGQLALYAAAMAGTAIYLASIDREPPGMKFRTTIMFLAAISALSAVAIYATTQVVDAVAETQDDSINLPSTTMLILSLAVYVAALSAAFLATLIDNERLSQRYEYLQGEHQDGLLEDFRSLES